MASQPITPILQGVSTASQPITLILSVSVPSISQPGLSTQSLDLATTTNTPTPFPPTSAATMMVLPAPTAPNTAITPMSTPQQPPCILSPTALPLMNVLQCSAPYSVICHTIYSTDTNGTATAVPMAGN